MRRGVDGDQLARHPLLSVLCANCSSASETVSGAEVGRWLDARRCSSSQSVEDILVWLTGDRCGCDRHRSSAEVDRLHLRQRDRDGLPRRLDGHTRIDNLPQCAVDPLPCFQFPFLRVRGRMLTQWIPCARLHFSSVFPWVPFFRPRRRATMMSLSRTGRLRCTGSPRRPRARRRERDLIPQSGLRRPKPQRRRVLWSSWP